MLIQKAVMLSIILLIYLFTKGKSDRMFSFNHSVAFFLFFVLSGYSEIFFQRTHSLSLKEELLLSYCKVFLWSN